VCHDVVQLTGDALALVGQSDAGAQFALAFESRRALLEDVGAELAITDRATGEPQADAGDEQ
jgi:hypothetical protein